MDKIGQFSTIIPKLNMVVADRYTVPTLVKWGLKLRGVSKHTYWELLYDHREIEN